MKKLYYAYLSLGLLALYIITTSSSLGRATDDNVGNTGAPGESQLCSNCHNNGSYGTVNVSIQVFENGTTNPVNFYIPNTVYDMRVTVTGSSGSPLGYGFQLTTMTGTNTPYAAYSSLASNVKLKAITSGAQAGRTYLEHNGVLNNNQFNFEWTAPASGNVTFYASGIACNANGGSGGDRAGNSNLSLPMAPTLTVSSSVTDISCFNANDGAIQVNVNSGVSPYSYLWSDGAITANRSNLGPGEYTVTVTDQLGQIFEDSFILTNPALLTADVFVSQPNVVGGTGTAEIFINGGNAPYTWTINGGAINTFPDLVAGMYMINILDANGCEISVSFEIIDPEGIQAIVTVDDATCFGSTNGQIELTISGGTPPYEVAWQANPGITPDGFAAGTYVAIITDAVGNQTQVSAEVGQPEPVLISADFEPILCHGATTEVTISASGGTAPFVGTGVFAVGAGEQQFTVTDAEGCTYTTFITFEQPSPFLGDSIFAELSCTDGDIVLQITASGGVEPYIGTGELHFENPGSYAIPLTDANGCSTLANVSIAAIDGPNLSSSITQPTCWGTCDGSIALDAGGAEGQFIWNDNTTGTLRQDLCPGVYTSTFTGTDGCVIVNSFTLQSPDSLYVIVNAPDSICADQVITANASAFGGIAPYTLNWSDGQVGTTVTLTAGDFIVTAEDANGCTAQTEWSISTYPMPQIFIDEQISPSCFGGSDGSISLTGVSFIGAIDYTWVPNVSATWEATNLFAGQYQITGVDPIGCPVTISVLLDQPTELEANLTIDDAQNGTGTLTVAPSGGTPPYTIAWSNGSTDASIEVPTGFYAVSVTDAMGCTTELVGLEIVSSVDENDGLTYNAYPNPFQNTLYVVGPGSYRITNALGEWYGQGSGSNALDTSTWPVGVYFIHHNNNSCVRLIKY
jgi:hypothetical protein